MNSLKRREFVTAADRLSLIIAEVPMHALPPLSMCWTSF